MNHTKIINLTNNKKVTVLKYFSSIFNENNTNNSIPSYVILGDSNIPTKLVEFNQDVPFKRNENNNIFEPLKITYDSNNKEFQYFDNSIYNDPKIVTGRTSVTKLNRIISQDKYQELRSSFIRSQKKISGDSVTAFVFFEEDFVNDYNVQIKLQRTYDTLDTLTIKNNIVGEWPQQECTTGVLFGKLVARQKLVNEQGINIEIPLRNVPVAIFNSSDEFENIYSTDEEGNRIKLNLKENSNPEMYFNLTAYNTDIQFLKLDSDFKIPDKYKYSTITNENGEFLLTDIPIGEQTFMFEIDLLKQGLTHDEVILNFFPYPVEDNPNVDNVPHFYFKQIPVNIVPSWGYYQTGYTELNITANLDLRKWTTFYHPPVSAYDKVIEENFALGLTSLISVLIRDMSKPNYPIGSEFVKIENNRDRNYTQILEWNNEFKLKSQGIQYDKNDFIIFKVPANIYDPNNYASKDSERKELSIYKGVWIAGYQFQIYYTDSSSLFRTTGYDFKWFDGYNQNTGYIGRDHFHLNRNNPPFTKNDPINSAAPQGIGNFPYEKPWTTTYPEPYKIPSIPVIQNPEWNNENLKICLDIPKYLDGDYIDKTFSNLRSGGFGIQYIALNWLSNNFSELITADKLYKYENEVSVNEMYSNGYWPQQNWQYINPQTQNIKGKISFNQFSKVVNGEKYQRVECGFGYFLKPHGWARIITYPTNNNSDSGFAMFADDTNRTNGINPQGELNNDGITYSYTINTNYRLAMYKFGQKEDLSIKLDNSNTTQVLQEGGLDIYRIINPINILEPQPKIEPTYVQFNFQNIYIQRGKTKGTVDANYVYCTTYNGFDTQIEKAFYDFYTMDYDSNTFKPYSIDTDSVIVLRIWNRGDIPIKFNNSKTNINVNESYPIDITNNPMSDYIDLRDFIQLPGNKNLTITDHGTLIYSQASYEFEFTNIKFYKTDKQNNNNLYVDEGNNPTTITINNKTYNTKTESQGTITYNLITNINNIKTNNDGSSCTNNLGSQEKYKHNVLIDGVAIINPLNNPNNTSIGYYDFREETKISATCPKKTIKENTVDTTTIPFQVV